MAKLGDEGKVVLGRSAAGSDVSLWLHLANRHGLVTGATGTGKTVTLQVLAEGFSREGVPVFAADIKGDLSGIAATGTGGPALEQRARTMGLSYEPDRFPVRFWDVFGVQGHPVRITVSQMGPLLLARLMGLNDTQEGVLNIVFRLADERGLLLLDLKDLRAMLSEVAKTAASLTRDYGNVSAATVGAIQRQVLVLETQGGDTFFGEPALRIADLMATDPAGRGVVSILAADRLMASPRLYACLLLWLLSELFEDLPEVGDLDRPKLVFFFDEAHLLFNEAPKALLEKVEQVVRLIRSKGVGVYFVTQTPLDVPEKVLAQLGNRVQHALRAFTPRDQKAVRAAAETFRPNPALDTASVIMDLGKGEALVSCLEGNGTPAMVERVMIRPPSARIGPLTGEERGSIMAASPLASIYDTAIDRYSAFEMLRGSESRPVPDTGAGPWGRAGGATPRSRGAGTSVPSAGTRPSSGGGEVDPAPQSPRGSTRMSTTELVVRQMARSVASQVGSQIGRAIVRGVLGGMKRE